MRVPFEGPSYFVVRIGWDEINIGPSSSKTMPLMVSFSPFVRRVPASIIFRSLTGTGLSSVESTSTDFA